MGVGNVIGEIRRSTRERFGPKEKTLIVAVELGGEIWVFALCRREGIAPAVYYRWPKAFLEAGKNDGIRDARRYATSEKIKRPKQDNKEQINLVGMGIIKNS